MGGIGVKRSFEWSLSVLLRWSLVTLVVRWQQFLVNVLYCYECAFSCGLIGASLTLVFYRRREFVIFSAEPIGSLCGGLIPLVFVSIRKELRPHKEEESRVHRESSFQGGFSLSGGGC